MMANQGFGFIHRSLLEGQASMEVHSTVVEGTLGEIESTVSDNGVVLGEIRREVSRVATLLEHLVTVTQSLTNRITVLEGRIGKFNCLTKSH